MHGLLPQTELREAMATTVCSRVLQQWCKRARSITPRSLSLYQYGITLAYRDRLISSVVQAFDPRSFLYPKLDVYFHDIKLEMGLSNMRECTNLDNTYVVGTWEQCDGSARRAVVVAVAVQEELLLLPLGDPATQIEDITRTLRSP